MRIDLGHKIFYAIARIGCGVALCAALFCFPSCRQTSDVASQTTASTQQNSLVRSPNAGEIHRLLVKPGETVNIGAPLLEILIPSDGIAAATPDAVQTTLPTKKSVPLPLTTQNDVEAQRAEVVRAESDVQRLTPLVAAGQASQGELDGARDRYERAQQRFQQAQKNQQAAQDTLIARRQAATKTDVSKSGRLLTVRAERAGKVETLDVQEGEAVSEGQTLLSIRVTEP